MITPAERRDLGRALSRVQNDSGGEGVSAAEYYRRSAVASRIVALTGPPGAGKSTLVDRLAVHWADRGQRVAVLAIDPSSPFSGGAMLGDRIRANAATNHPSVYLRSMSARESPDRMVTTVVDSCAVLSHFRFDRILLETVGAGQMNLEALDLADCIVTISVPGLGDAVQLSKAGLLEIADIHVVNKADLEGAGQLRAGLQSMLDIAYPAPGREFSDSRRAQPGAAALLARHGDPARERITWRPPVLAVSAAQNDNVSSICEEVDKFLQWSDDTDRYMARRRARLRNLAAIRLKHKILQRFDEDKGGAIEAFVGEIIEGRLDPSGAVRRLLDQSREASPVGGPITNRHTTMKFSDPALNDGGAEAHRRWHKTRYEKAIEEIPEVRRFRLDIGIDVDPLYTPSSLEEVGFDYGKDVGYPGQFPFTRGDRSAMCRNEPFVVSAYTGIGDAVTSNERFRKLLDLGVEQILVALDLPTQCGYDSDDLMAAGEVGKVGVAVNSLADMELMFEGIPLDSVKRVGTLGNSIGPIALALFVALAEKQGVALSDCVVNLQNDVLKEYLARGTQILKAEPAARLVGDCVAWCVDQGLDWSPLTVCCNHLNAGGAGSSWASSIALGHAIYYLDDLVKRGYDIEKIAPLVHMFPDERHDFFSSVANLRAMRKLWATLLRERYDAKSDAALGLRTTVYGHGMETLQEPLNNIVRIAYGTLAYVMGGASYVYLASFDESVGTPTEDTVRVAVRTQQILAHEHGFGDTIDPLGGSYYVETLTKKIEQQIRRGLDELLAQGGALEVIRNGFARKLMAEGVVRRQRAIDAKERPWVTVNLQRVEPNVPNTALRLDPETESRQLERTRSVRARRDATQAEAALARVRAACRSGENMVPPVIDAVRAYVTVGEICQVWREEFGVFEPSTAF